MSHMMAQLSRFDTCTRASLGRLLDILPLQRAEHLMNRAVMIHGLGGTDNAIQIIKLSPLYLGSGGHNSEARSKALQLLNNPLQLERVGLDQTGFIRTKPGSPAGPWHGCS
jgi:hypothetical protein